MVDHSSDVTVEAASPASGEITPSADLWWLADASNDRTLDWYAFLLELNEKHGDPEAYLNRLVAASSLSTYGVLGYTPLPSEEFLDRTYRLVGDAYGWSNIRGWDRIEGAFGPDENPTLFERWKDAFSKRGGFLLNESTGRPAVATGWSSEPYPRVGGILYRNRARTISRVADWTYDEAEYIASGLSMLEAPDGAPSWEWRQFTENSMRNKSNDLDWENFLSNPNLPLGETEGLFRELVNHLYSAVAANDNDPRIVKKLGWVLMNPNAPGDEILNDLDIVYYNASVGGVTIPGMRLALEWHPNWAGPVQIPAAEAVKQYTDEWVERAIAHTRKGDDIALDGLQREALPMLATPACEEQVRKIISFALETNEFALLYSFSPALPAILCELERQMSDSVGNLPLSWILEVAGLNVETAQ